MKVHCKDCYYRFDCDGAEEQNLDNEGVCGMYEKDEEYKEEGE